MVPVPDRPYFFLRTLLFFSTRFTVRPKPIFSGWLRAARTACQNGVCCHNNYWTKLPKFVGRNYASLVNIDVGTLLKIAQQKNAKTIFSHLPTLIFSRYETETTGFFRPNEENYTVCSWGQTVSTLGKSTVNERWHSSHNVDALKTVILCCTNTIIKDSFVQNCPYIFLLLDSPVNYT
jgi:hypothetical protein